MKRMRLLVLVIAVLLPAGAFAADFGQASSIMSATMSPGPDSLSMGGCWVALPNFSSNNPAVVAAGDPYKAAVSYSFNWIKFGRGPSLGLHITSLSVTLPKGVLQLNAANANSASAGTAMEADMKFGYSSYIELMYGLPVMESLIGNDDKLFLGFGGVITASRINFSQLGQSMFVARSRGFEAKTGFLYQPFRGLNFGGMYAYSRDRNEDRELTINEEVSSQSWSSKRSTSDLHQFRLGASWQVLPRLLLAADYQHLNVGHLKRDQYFVGAEFQVVKEIMSLYAGCANGGPTVGLGVYPNKHAGLNVAYGKDLFRDLNPHLGRSQMVSAMLNLNF